jgi:O-antigen/teichoic acid export membrane protein
LLVNRGGGYGEMGIYSAAGQWFAVLLFLPSALGQAALPMLSQAVGAGEFGQARQLLTRCIGFSAAAVLPLVLVASAASPYIMRFYGASFASGWPVLVVVLLTAALVAGQVPVGHVIAASGRMWIGFLMNAGWAAAFVGLTFAMLPWGALGLAAARGAAYLAHATWTFGYALAVLKRRGVASGGPCAGGR